MGSDESGVLASLVAPVVDGAGLVLENVLVAPVGRRRQVRVVVDLPEGRTGTLDLDTVAEVSRAVATVLEEADPWPGAPYVLEVSSPGVDRPLTERRHWSRARGRLVTVSADGERLSGRVSEVDDDGVVLEVSGEPRRATWAQLGPGRVQVEFNPPAPDRSEEG